MERFLAPLRSEHSINCEHCRMRKKETINLAKLVRDERATNGMLRHRVSENHGMEVGGASIGSSSSPPAMKEERGFGRLFWHASCLLDTAAGGLPLPHLRAFPVETGRLLAPFFFSGAL